MKTYSHDGCGTYYRVRLTVCPRHPDIGPLEEMAMPKITVYGGPTNFGLNESSAGFAENTGAIRAGAEERIAEPLVAGGEEPEPGEPPFDPGELSVNDVLTLLEDCSDAEAELVLQAERKGKNRKGIVGS